MRLHRDRSLAGHTATVRFTNSSNWWLEMADTVHSLSTSGLSPKKQIQCWSDALTDLCGQFDIDPLKASSLEARINYTTVSQLKLCQIEVSQHRIAHTVARAKSNSANIPTSRYCFRPHGISYFEQDGRRIELKPGDCLAYDVSCPHTIISPALTRHEVVIVPKALLQERGFLHIGCQRANFRRAQAPGESPMTSCMPRLTRPPNCHRTTPSSSPIR